MFFKRVMNGREDFMVKIKRLITSFVLVGLVMSFFTPDNFVSAEEVDGKCSITIDANVHLF